MKPVYTVVVSAQNIKICLAEGIAGAERILMISLKITPVKGFMSALLSKNIFDNFWFSEGEIETFGKFTISGYLVKDFYSTEEWEALSGRKYATWAELRPYVYQLIRGTKTPHSFKFVLLLSAENTARVLSRSGTGFTPDQVGGLFLNIRFEKNEVHLITGLSLKVFSMDKSLEFAWDQDMKTFLKHHEIPFEEE